MFPYAIPNPKADYLRVTHPFATLKRCKHLSTVRLACLKRAASVRSEPGSNSPLYIFSIRRCYLNNLSLLLTLTAFQLLASSLNFLSFSFPSLFLLLKTSTPVNFSLPASC